MNNNTENWLYLKRTVRFGETDAAGVMHFHQLFRWCHEAWEESLQNFGLPNNEIFPSLTKGNNLLKVALPVVYCHANFRNAIFSGDNLQVVVKPIKLNSNSFEIHTAFQRNNKSLAIGLIRHMAIDPKTRQRVHIPIGIEKWIEASSINQGPIPT